MQYEVTYVVAGRKIVWGTYPDPAMAADRVGWLLTGMAAQSVEVKRVAA